MTIPAGSDPELNGLHCLQCGVLYENHPSAPTANDHEFITFDQIAVEAKQIVERSKVIGRKAAMIEYLSKNNEERARRSHERILKMIEAES